MKAMEKYMPQNAKMADIGTGSGILAICALKLGAISAYGCDNDETVIDVCNENALKNGVGTTGNIKFELTTADKLNEQFDFVCANILHNVLAEIMGYLKNILAPNGKLVLSGILDEKKPVVLNSIEKQGLKIIDTIHQDQWVAFVVEK
jgi:ribosomal protein L11 methyltransferase